MADAAQIFEHPTRFLKFRVDVADIEVFVPTMIRTVVVCLQEIVARSHVAQIQFHILEPGLSAPGHRTHITVSFTTWELLFDVCHPVKKCDPTILLG